ncbi:MULTISPECIES: YtxH domain-containing protein [unclassified Clostridium]|uniref:YtxH domain-containing protein n=1 Tax=unclassified Clostridium TaxID=2614128 RepID=UPI0018999A67|nr:MULTISPECIES: YtxH domain-containing protein [unclassified Clostridium]MCR1951361.1 YtxH domain-containing protein [Clostridium sp. DSM 100503]
MAKMMRSMAAGAMLGMAVSAMVLPQLDRRTQRNIRRASKRAINMAGDAYDTIMGYMK